MAQVRVLHSAQTNNTIMLWKKKPKEFKSLQELMDTPKFKELIETTISLRLLKGANTLEGADETVRLKESDFLKLNREGKMTPEALAAEFLLIDFNQSTLPSSQRTYIRSVVENAIVGTLEFYQS